MSSSGYVYALVNPSLEGLVKVGKTTTSPEKRAAELSSSTGVPMPFIVAYSVIVSDCDLAEKYIHGLLEKNGFRVTTNREFFQAPLTTIIDAIKTTASFIGILTENDFNLTHNEQANYQADNSAWIELESNAYKHWNNGWDGREISTYKDLDEHVDLSINLYSKAASAGSIRAYYMLGCIHIEHAQELFQQTFKRTYKEKIFGDDRTIRRRRHIGEGLENHRLALKNGYDLSYAALACYFGSGGYLGETDNTPEAKKHWDIFFQSQTFRKRIDPYDEFTSKHSIYYSAYSGFLHNNLKIDWHEAGFHTDQKFNV